MTTSNDIINSILSKPFKSVTKYTNSSNINLNSFIKEGSILGNKRSSPTLSEGEKDKALSESENINNVKNQNNKTIPHLKNGSPRAFTIDFTRKTFTAFCDLLKDLNLLQPIEWTIKGKKRDYTFSLDSDTLSKGIYTFVKMIESSRNGYATGTRLVQVLKDSGVKIDVKQAYKVIAIAKENGIIAKVYYAVRFATKYNVGKKFSVKALTLSLTINAIKSISDRKKKIFCIAMTAKKHLKAKSTQQIFQWALDEGLIEDEPAVNVYSTMERIIGDGKPTIPLAAALEGDYSKDEE